MELMCIHGFACVDLFRTRGVVLLLRGQSLERLCLVSTGASAFTIYDCVD